MEFKKPFDQSEDRRKKAQDAIDHAREIREHKIANLGKKRTAAGPHLIADGSLQRCSVCRYPFFPDTQPSKSEAFAEHLRKAHKPGQTSEDFSQAAVRVVKEATEKL